MATTNEITQSIIAQARLIDANISLEVGTPERKIVEAVAESIASASVDIEVLSGQLYMDELTGGRLDSFISLFGFGRQIGTRATGIVTVSRSGTANLNSTIRQGTQFMTRPSSNIPGLTFVSTETIKLNANETKAYIRVECTTAGTIGNLPSGVISGITNSINLPGITSIVNEVPTSGGSDTEADASLKARFQNSIFRNMAGTNDQYLAIALSHSAVSKANVIGAQSTYIEYVQVPASRDGADYEILVVGTPVYTTSLSSVPYSKHSYANNYFVAKGSGQNAAFLRPNVEYIFNLPARDEGGSKGNIPVGNVVPNITMIGNGTNLKVNGVPTDVPFAGGVFLFEHKYMSKASRNDWREGIYNCVDVYVNSQQSQLATSEEVFPSVLMEFVDDPTKISHRGNFMRTATAQVPSLTSRLHVLYHQPMVDVPDGSITIGNLIFREAKYVADNGKAYTQQVYKNPATGNYHNDTEFKDISVFGDYFIIEDVSNNRGTIHARNGIEWLENTFTGENSIVGGMGFPVEYEFNLSIRQLQAVMERSKQITTDVLVHQSDLKYMRLHITVMYTPGFTETNVNKQIVDSVNVLFAMQYYGATIQMSDILQAIHNTSGVDNVRWTYETPIDNPNDPKHKLEIVTKDGNSFKTRTFYDKDFILNDDELPSLADTQNYSSIKNAVVIQVKAQNTWDSN